MRELQIMRENMLFSGEIYTAGKIFTVTAVTNLTSDQINQYIAWYICLKKWVEVYCQCPSSTAVLCCSGTLVLAVPIQYCSTLVLWYPCTASAHLVLQYSGALVPLYCRQCQSRATTALIRRYPFLDPRPQSQATW